MKPQVHVLKLSIPQGKGLPAGLVTTHQAQQLVSEVQGLLPRLQGTIFHLDFTEVHHLMGGAARELGPKLHHWFVLQRQAHQHLVYTHLTSGVLQALDCTFAVHGHRQVALAVQEGQEPTLLGSLPDHLKEVLMCLYQHGVQTSTDLEARGIQAASKKLSVLMKQYPWLLSRERQLNGGHWHHLHSPIPWRLGAPELPGRREG